MATYQIRQLWKKCQFDPEFISQCWDGFGYETRLQSVPILFEKGNNFLWRRDSTWRWTCPGWGLPDGKIQIDASELEQRIKEEGMAAIDRMLLFRGRSESPEKVPASCLISAFGEVFHGVNGLNEYCKCQSEKSSPYVIKKTSLIENMYEPNLRRFDYMICSDSEEAKAWMCSLTNENLEYDPDNPPFITYVERMRYMTIH